MARRPKPSVEQEYTCRGTLELSGVVFTIKARSLEEAKEKARNGDWEEWAIDSAESINWTLNPKTVEPNE